MTAESNVRPDFDPEIVAIANYVSNFNIISEVAYETAYYCLMDSIGCALLAHRFPECTKLLGPIVPHDTLMNGARVIGTQFELNPVTAAFNNGALIRWLDYNDTWLAAEWGHPSDNLGGILAVCDYISRQNLATGKAPLTVYDVLTAMIKAYEIQGILALENSFNRVGLDHVILVKLATTSVITHLLGGNVDTLCNAISLALLDGQSLRTYRHAPNTGSRKSWAAGDATSRGVFLALLALKGEMGYPSVLSAKTWGFCDIYFDGQPLKITRDYTSYVMENILFKIAYPAEFHGQTAVECALKLHDKVKNKLPDIEKIEIKTQESAVRIINKQGPLHNAADRDHSLQYMIAIGLIYGELTSDHYEDGIATNPLIDELRTKMQVREEQAFTKDYLDSQKRSIANSIQIFFKDGTSTEEVRIDYPLGHKQRRQEGIPLLRKKFKNNLATRFPKERAKNLEQIFEDKTSLLTMPITDLMNLLTI
ncbi:MAG: bifunctional 2-methylcitrate dehydratase/aconitate hydratase [Gammaproteobacteria bacterium]|nr:bifunctional 2-methylcitrate dehydratase/aconitate hydratase [Gammaproteobacteria bacterium]